MSDYEFAVGKRSVVVFSYDVACEVDRGNNGWDRVIVKGGGESWSGKTMKECMDQKEWERPGMLAESFEFIYLS
jgi:hypothetical protein